MKIRIELWMWLGNRLAPDFDSLSDMRSAKEVEVEEGLTVIQLFDLLASRYPLIGEKVFDREKGHFHPNLSIVVTQDGRVVSPFKPQGDAMKDGQKITVLPLYVGG